MHRHGLRVVMVFVQATKPGPPGADSGVGSAAVEDGEQLVTVVVPGSIGAGVGQSI